MMAKVGFEQKLSDREVDVLIGEAKDLTLCSLYNISNPTQKLKVLEGKIAFFYVEIAVNGRGEDDVIEQITFVLSRKSNDTILRQLDETISCKQRVQETDRIFARFCDRLLEIYNGAVYIYLAGCQDANQLGERFIAFVKKDECIKGSPDIHYILACDDEKTAISNNSVFNFSKKLDVKRLIYMNKTNEAYISHTWSGQSNMSSIQISDSLRLREIPYSIDRKDCKYLDNIREYEEKLINASVIIAVIDDDYLHSLNSMAELSSIFEKGNESKTMPLLLGGRKIIEEDKQIPLTESWENKLKELNEKMAKPYGDENKNYARDKDVMERILRQLPNIFQYFTNTNVPPAEVLLAKDNVEGFYGEICNRLGIKSKKSIDIKENTQSGDVYNAEKINVFKGPVHIDKFEM